MAPVPSRLDQLLPRYDAAERHSRLVHAAPDRALAAFRGITLRELPLVALLFAARSLPARLTGTGPSLPSAADRPLFEQFLAGGFTVLHDDPDREVVIGLIAQMWRPGGRVVRPTGADHFRDFTEPGFARAVLSFSATAEDGATRVVTETRVSATDDGARRAFRRYWLVVGPFSALIRRVLLGAVAARAEAPPRAADTAGA